MHETYQPPKLSNLARWLAGYGIFLFVIGLIGYLSNPEAAKTALISGGVFGSLSLLLAFGLSRGLRPLRWVALGMIAFLCVIFSWRSTVSWMAVADGEPKLLAAVLITSMLAASVVMVYRLIVEGRKSSL